MAGGMILEEELSISFGNEADHLLPQNTRHCVVNIFEFIESQSNLDFNNWNNLSCAVKL